VIGHTSSFPVGGQPEEEGRGGREEENNAPEGGRSAQTYAQTGQAKNHTDPHDPLDEPHFFAVWFHPH